IGQGASGGCSAALGRAFSFGRGLNVRVYVLDKIGILVHPFLHLPILFWSVLSGKIFHLLYRFPETNLILEISRDRRAIGIAIHPGPAEPCSFVAQRQASDVL